MCRDKLLVSITLGKSLMRVVSASIDLIHAIKHLYSRLKKKKCEPWESSPLFQIPGNRAASIYYLYKVVVVVVGCHLCSGSTLSGYFLKCPRKSEVGACAAVAHQNLGLLSPLKQNEKYRVWRG